MQKIKFAVFGLIGFVLSAYANISPVHATESNAIDLSNYRSFAFYDTAGKDPGGDHKTVTGQRLEDAISAHMERRGYHVDIHYPDLLIDYHVDSVTLKDPAPRRPGPPPPYFYDPHGPFPYGRFHYGPDPWMGHPGPRRMAYHEQGKVTVTVVDRKSSKVVWEGQFTGDFDPDAPAIPADEVRGIVSEIFKQFPYHAAPGAS